MLIALSGLKGSGKDTAAAGLVKRGYVHVAFANALRDLLLAIDPIVSHLNWPTPMRLSDVVRDLGWDTAKRTLPEIRRLMQKIGTEGIRTIFGDNAWVDVLFHNYPDLFDPDTKYVLTDCRFKNEGEFVRNNGGVIIWIDRSGITSDGHASESTAVRDMADVIIQNDGSIEELQTKIVQALIKKEV